MLNYSTLHEFHDQGLLPLTRPSPPPPPRLRPDDDVTATRMNEREEEELTTGEDAEEGLRPPTSVLWRVADTSRARWNHIKDLDSFFVRVYQYHQMHGFTHMVLRECLEIVQYLFILFLCLYLGYGVNYSVMFHKSGDHKVTLDEVCLPIGECIDNFSGWTWFGILVAFAVLLVRTVLRANKLFLFWDIKQFYNVALGVADRELDNLTWHDIQTKVLAVQREQQMCIHKRELTELDIYHRILRQENYLVAMANKGLLPPRFNIPCLGEYVYWTESLRSNIQLLFFSSPWAVFENSWHLREEYKKANLRHELAQQMKTRIYWLALAHLLLLPVMFVWEFLMTVFSNFALVYREPKMLVKRRWSLYGRTYLRHFNELDHELNARLSRAYKPACKYLAAFGSPLLELLAEYVGFMLGTLLTVLVGLTLYDETVLQVHNVLVISTVLLFGLTMMRSMIRDEEVHLNLEDLLAKVMINANYMPIDWYGRAHTETVRRQFESMFTYSAVNIAESALDPLLKPFVLVFCVAPRTLEIVDFFRNFTVSVVGVGDVCSFAQMDVRRHGHPDFHEAGAGARPAEVNNDQYSQGELGKTELSLVHFATTNPNWRAPEDSEAFVQNVREQSTSWVQSKTTGNNDLLMAAASGIGSDPATTSAMSPMQSSLYRATRDICQSFGNTGNDNNDSGGDHEDQNRSRPNQWRIGEPVHSFDNPLVLQLPHPLHDLEQQQRQLPDLASPNPQQQLPPRFQPSQPQQQQQQHHQRGVSAEASNNPMMSLSTAYNLEGPSPSSVLDMSVSAAYLTEVYHNNVLKRRTAAPSRSAFSGIGNTARVGGGAQETTPLLPTSGNAGYHQQQLQHRQNR